MKPALRPVWARIDLAAIRANVEALRAATDPVRLLAVVKADAYGHGAAPVARAAVQAGATMLGVALVEEGIALREAGIDAPVLVLSEPVADAAEAVVDYRLTPAVYTEAGLNAIEDAAQRRGRPVAVQVKVDTGMHRVGATSAVTERIAQRAEQSPHLMLEAVWTHLAVADERDHPYNAMQLERFRECVEHLGRLGIRPAMLHAANTAGALSLPDARYDMVRTGIGIYGIAPAEWLDPLVDLQPALSVHAAVSFCKRVSSGEALSYGLRYRLGRDSSIVTIPIGYADGVPRLLGERGGEVLIHGRRYPIAGTVTMDQILVDVGDDHIEVGADVVMLGAQGDEAITATEWAQRIGTIPYEIVCGIAPRVPRSYVGALT